MRASLAVLGWLWVAPALAAAPVVSGVTVVDVTPAGFGLVVAVSPGARVGVRVFDDAGGAVTASTARVEGYGGTAALETASTARGLHRVAVTGLSGGRSYYAQVTATDAVDGSVTTWPADAPQAVALPARVVDFQAADNTRPPVENPLALHAFSAGAGVPPPGSVVTLEVAGGRQLSSLVGEGTAADTVGVDLANLYGPDQPQRLAGGEALRMRVLTDAQVATTRGWKLPATWTAGRAALQPYTQDLALVSGWNLVSLQVEPADPSVGAVFGDAAVVEVWTWNNGAWLSWTRATATGDLDRVAVQRGYFVLAQASATLPVSGGWALDPVPLLGGFNLAGYRELQPVPVVDATAGLAGALRTVWAFDAAAQAWRCYRSGVPDEVNDLTTLEPGRGYLLDLSLERGW